MGPEPTPARSMTYCYKLLVCTIPTYRVYWLYDTHLQVFGVTVI